MGIERNISEELWKIRKREDDLRYEEIPKLADRLVLRLEDAIKEIKFASKHRLADHKLQNVVGLITLTMDRLDKRMGGAVQQAFEFEKETRDLQLMREILERVKD